MLLARTGTVLGAVVAATATLVAIASIWLVLVDPVTVADAVTKGGSQAFFEAVAGAIVEALKQVVRWL